MHPDGKLKHAPPIRRRHFGRCAYLKECQPEKPFAGTARSRDTRFDFLAEQMPQQGMHFLNARRGCAGNGDEQIHLATKLAAGFACEGGGENVRGFGLPDGGENVCAIAGCRDGDREIARARKGFDLA